METNESAWKMGEPPRISVISPVCWPIEDLIADLDRRECELRYHEPEEAILVIIVAERHRCIGDLCPFACLIIVLNIIMNIIVEAEHDHRDFDIVRARTSLVFDENLNVLATTVNRVW